MPFGIHHHSHHWRDVAVLFLIDGLIVWAAFVFGIWFRFGELSELKLAAYGPSLIAASIAMPTVFYIGGLYSSGRFEEGFVHHLRWLAMGLLAVLISTLAVGSLNFSSRIGRGVLAVAFSALVLLTCLRHLWVVRSRKRRWRRVLCLICSEEDEAAANLLQHLWGKRASYLGVIWGKGYRVRSELPVAGEFSHLCLESETFSDVDMVLVREQHLADPEFGPALRQLRYHGTEIVSLADACEEAYNAVPLDLVSDNWLFRASSQAGLFYIKKLKRLFDVSAALFFLTILSPFLAVGALLVRFASPGPVLFRQVRAGRLERPITVVKLRTMHVDSERGGAKWSGSEDPRVFRAGKWLRKFRIDEIPQLVNVIKGDMSFVGPRPEQVSLVDLLDERVPFYRERLLVQPGLTGWAQVNYPYGATIDDAARKLEYDLYYMKHMSLFLDFFILIETTKIMLLGGVRSDSNRAYSEFRLSIETLNSSPEGRQTPDEAETSILP